MVDKHTEKMSVADVRKALSLLRNNWNNHTPDNPFCLSDTLDNNFTFSEFCFVFIMSHHTKRQITNEENRKAIKPKKNKNVA